MSECKTCFREMTFVNHDGVCPYCTRIRELQADRDRLAAMLAEGVSLVAPLLEVVDLDMRDNPLRMWAAEAARGGEASGGAE